MIDGLKPSSSSEPVHQAIFRRSRDGGTTVSCKCRAVLGKHDRRYGDFHEPMPQDSNQTVWQTYNLPENHWAPFTEQDKIQT